MHMKRLVVDKKRLVMIAGLIVLFLLIIDLNNRIVINNRLSSERNQMGTQVSNLRATATMMHTQIAFATSEAAVDLWAREKGHYVQPGDQLVIPLPPPGVTQAPVFVPTPTIPSVEPWEVWWALFFGD